MASSGGHLLVQKTLRVLRYGVEKAGRAVREKLGQAASVEVRAERVYAQINRQPIDRLAAIKQGQRRNYSSTRLVNNAIRYISNAANTSSQPLRSSYPTSRTRTAVSQLTSRTPFASTLRPNLTGGTLSRFSGGYGNSGRIGGARYFSHGPAQPVEVVQNVSQAVRAFWFSGQKARFNGLNSVTGNKRFRAVSTLQDKACSRIDMSNKHSAGSFVDFKITPTITAVGPLSSVPRAASYSEDDCEPSLFSSINVATITDERVMSNLAVDFARALKDLAAIMNDIKHLSTLGDLPLVLLNPHTLRVRFPGCDADTVEGLCRELNIRRGIVGQDGDFEIQHGTDMALMFPFAPSKNVSEYGDGSRPVKRAKVQRDNIDWCAMLSAGTQSVADPAEYFEHVQRPVHEDIDPIGYMTSDGEIVQNPWLSSPSGYSSLRASDDGCEDATTFFAPAQTRYTIASRDQRDQVSEYEGLEGIYRFIAQCDSARR